MFRSASVRSGIVVPFASSMLLPSSSSALFFSAATAASCPVYSSRRFKLVRVSHPQKKASLSSKKATTPPGDDVGSLLTEQEDPVSGDFEDDTYADEGYGGALNEAGGGKGKAPIAAPVALQLLTTDQVVRAMRSEYRLSTPANTLIKEDGISQLSAETRERSIVEYEEDSNAILAQIKVNTRHVTVQDGKVVAMPFIPRTAPSDFEIAAEVVARTLIVALGLRPLLQFHFEVAFSSAPAVVHTPHVAVAELTSSRPLGADKKKLGPLSPIAVETGGSSSPLKRNKITHERDATVRVVIRNSRTNSREATAVLVFHVDHKL